MCIYDIHGIPCCTKNLDLVHEWFKSGWFKGDAPPMQAWLKIMGTEEESAKVIHDQEWAVFPDQIYHLNSGSKKIMWKNKEVPQTRYQFECPTHHPAPPRAVAILLGNS